MIKKLKRIFDLFRKGERVVDSRNWKNSALIAAALSPFLYALDDVLREFGVHTGLNRADLEMVAYSIGSIASAVIIVATTITSKGVGLPAKKTEGEQ